jgi:hypothetical protein
MAVAVSLGANDYASAEREQPNMPHMQAEFLPGA